MRLLLIRSKSKGFSIEHKYTVALTQLSFREKKPFCGDTKKIPLRSWSDNHRSCYLLWVCVFFFLLLLFIFVVQSPERLQSKSQKLLRQGVDEWMSKKGTHRPSFSRTRDPNGDGSPLHLQTPRPCCIISRRKKKPQQTRKVKKTQHRRRLSLPRAILSYILYVKSIVHIKCYLFLLILCWYCHDVWSINCVQRQKTRYRSTKKKKKNFAQNPWQILHHVRARPVTANGKRIAFVYRFQPIRTIYLYIVLNVVVLNMMECS